jgi:hypothetical protein
MDEEVKFKPVYYSNDHGAIALIKSLLDTNNIVYYVDNENAAALASCGVSPLMTVMVSENQVSLVEELLK